MTAITPRTLPALLLLAALGAPAGAQPPAVPPALAPWAQQLGTLATAQLQRELAYAYQHHIGDSRPLPAEVQVFLRGIIPDQIIDAARYTVSDDAPTLPALLNRGNRELLQQDHAVSILNLVIFSREPTFASAADARWWAHELGHHIQYRRWGGIEAFAQRYVADFQGIEREAETFGRQAMTKYIEQERESPARTP